jgi:putative transcriptional regulator
VTKRFPVGGARRTKSPVRVDWSGRIVAMRGRVGLTQKEFAAMVGVSCKTLENWEQGRRQPTGPAAVLLTVLERDPGAVMGAVR